MINDIKAVIACKLSDVDRQVCELQQACVLYGIGTGCMAHRLQAIREAIEVACDASCSSR